MSFSLDTKFDICDCKIKNDCCKEAELYGVVLFAQTITTELLKLTTENVIAINLLNQLASEVVGVNFTIGENVNSYFAYLDKDRLEKVYDKFFIMVNGKIDLSISAVITENTCCKYSFLRGVFLAAGYVANPSKRYHFDISTPYYSLAKKLEKFMADLGFPVKTVVRNSNYVVYMKESAAIERFLGYIGANSAVFAFMDSKIYKEMNNYNNRINNTKLHNLDKTIVKSVEQVNAIEKIKNSLGLESLDDDLQYVAKLRLENPAKSLNELILLCNGKFSRSGLNRRLNKLVEISLAIEG